MSISFFLVAANNSKTSDIQINEAPMYDNVKKSEEMNKMDEEFIKTALQSFKGDKRKASHYLVLKGWEYLWKNDIKTAIKRFNQAWLVDPENYGVYWGFGAYYSYKYEFDQAIGMLDKAVEMNPSDERLMVEYVHVLNGAITYENSLEKKKKYSRQAKDVYEKAAALQIQLPELYCEWAVSLYSWGDYKEAMSKLNKAKELGIKEIDPQFFKDLKQKLSEE